MFLYIKYYCLYILTVHTNCFLLYGRLRCQNFNFIFQAVFKYIVHTAFACDDQIAMGYYDFGVIHDNGEGSGCSKLGSKYYKGLGVKSN